MVPSGNDGNFLVRHSLILTVQLRHVLHWRGSCFFILLVWALSLPFTLEQPPKGPSSTERYGSSRFPAALSQDVMLTVSAFVRVRLFPKFLGPWARVRPCRTDMNDVDGQEELWTWLEGEVKKHVPLP